MISRNIFSWLCTDFVRRKLIVVIIRGKWRCPLRIQVFVLLNISWEETFETKWAIPPLNKGCPLSIQILLYSIVKFTTESSNCENLLLVFRVIPRTNPRKLLKASNEVWRFSTSLFPPVDWLDLTNRRNIVAYCPAYCSSRNKKRMYEQGADGWRRHAN